VLVDDKDVQESRHNARSSTTTHQPRVCAAARGEGARVSKADARTHETSWEGEVGSCTTVDEDLSLLEDHHALLVGEGVLQSIPEKDHQREGCTKLVRSSGHTRCETTGKLVKHPVVWGIEPLLVLLWSPSHVAGE
jgi:hypothetical protein